MKRAQAWAKGEMERIGLVNVAVEPFMDYGVTWDNEYVSLHMLEPDYQPMVGFPLAHTPGTSGKVITRAVIADIQSRQDLEQYRGKLKGVAVLASPPAVIDTAAMAAGQPRRTEDSPNPSFLCLSPDRKTLFAVNEHWKEGEVSSFRVEAETGALTFLGKQSTQGGSPCHLCTDPAGKWLFVANHNDGSLAMFPIEEGGRRGA